MNQKHTVSVQRMTIEQLKMVIKSGSLLSAAAKYELQKRGVAKG
jgi:hypothetical protein